MDSLYLPVIYKTIKIFCDVLFKLSICARVASCFLSLLEAIAVAFCTIVSFANLLRQSLPLYENLESRGFETVSRNLRFFLSAEIGCWYFFNFILKQDSNFSPPFPFNFNSSISITQFSNPFSVLKTRAVIRSASPLLRWFK